MKTKTILTLCLITAGYFAISTHLNALTTILDTEFTANTTNPPDNIRWMSSSGVEFTAPGAHGYMRLEPSNNNRDVVAYFPKVELEIGQTLTLNYTVSILGAANSGNAFRIGLFDSNDATKVSGNNFGQVFADYTGYLLKSNPRSSGNGSTIAIHGSSYLIAGSASGFPNISPATIGSEFGNTNEILTGFISITNNGAAGVSISYQVPGRTVTETYVDTEYEYISFDSIGFNMQSAGGTNVTFHDMSLTVIPEAKHLSFLFGTAALACAFFGRRRASRQRA